MDIPTILEAWQTFTESTQIGPVKNEADCDFMMDLHDRLLDHLYSLNDDSFIPVRALCSFVETLIDDYVHLTEPNEETYLDTLLPQFMEEVHQFLLTMFKHSHPEKGVHSVPELHGFISATLLAPTCRNIPEWFALVWGGEDYLPQWKDEEESECVHLFHCINLRLFEPFLQTLLTSSSTCHITRWAWYP